METTAAKRGRASLSSVAEGGNGSAASKPLVDEPPVKKRSPLNSESNLDPVVLLLGKVPSTAVQKDMREQVLRQLARSISHAAATEDLNIFLRELQLGILERQAETLNGSSDPDAAAEEAPPLPTYTATAALEEVLLPRRRGTLVLAPASWGHAQASNSQQVPQKSKKVAVRRRQSGPLPPVPSFTDDKVGAAPSSSSTATVLQPSGTASDAPGDIDSANIPVEVLQRIISELSERPIVSDGVLDEARLERVVLQLLKCGVLPLHADASSTARARWAKVWHAMLVPADLQVTAVTTLLRLGIEFKDSLEDGHCPSRRVAQLVTELVKGHRVKLRSVEHAVRGSSTLCVAPTNDGEDAWLSAVDACGRRDRGTGLHAGARWRRAQLFCAEVLMQLFPQPAQAGWGWSRVGWSWASWWACVCRVLEEAEPHASFSVIVTSLSLMQECTGMPLLSQEAWQDELRVSKLRAKLLELIVAKDTELDRLLHRAGISFGATEAEAQPSEPRDLPEDDPDIIDLEDEEETLDAGDHEAEAAALHADIRRLELRIAMYSNADAALKADDVALEDVAEEEEMAAMASDVVEEVTALDADLA